MKGLGNIVMSFQVHITRLSCTRYATLNDIVVYLGHIHISVSAPTMSYKPLVSCWGEKLPSLTRIHILFISILDKSSIRSIKE